MRLLGSGANFMKKEQGFSLIDISIALAIIAIIAAIAIPGMLQARMAANESGAIQGCRTVGSAEVAYAEINNQSYATLANLVSGGFLDSRFSNSFNGYTYADRAVTGSVGGNTTPEGFGVVATPTAAGKARYLYGIGPDRLVRYQGALTGVTPAVCGSGPCTAGDPIENQSSGS
jgi:prepilin-type N-terminal cleavage/methylation domain-containing protein